eukprot:scaffold57025_cov19-Tisochrysis_lutea.AAC.2
MATFGSPNYASFSSPCAVAVPCCYEKFMSVQQHGVSYSLPFDAHGGAWYPESTGVWEERPPRLASLREPLLVYRLVCILHAGSVSRRDQSGVDYGCPALRSTWIYCTGQIPEVDNSSLN